MENPMTFHLTAISCFLCLALLSPIVHAGDIDKGLRDRADSKYRIAKKAYRQATKKYGESLKALPDVDRASGCQKIRWAIHANRVRVNMESLFKQKKYEKQLRELEGYSKAYGCP